MTDFTYIAPPGDGLRRAMAEARRRRFRSAGMSTGATAAVIAIAAAVAGAQGSQSLMQKPVEQLPAVTGVEHGRHSDSVDHAPATSYQVSSVTTFSVTMVGGGTQPAAASSQAPKGTRATVKTPAPTQAKRAAKPYVAGDLIRTDNQFSVPNCGVDGNTSTATDVCPSASASGSSSSYSFTADVCSTRASTALLHYGGRDELDFAVYRGGKEVWRWSQWHPDGGVSHTLSVSPGQCVQWDFTWTGVDAQGKALPTGDYTMRTTFLADELGGRNVIDSDCPVS